MLIKKIILFLLVSAFFCSCAIKRANRFAYANMPKNILYARQKGDAKLTAFQFSDANGENKGFAIQTGYAISNHVAVIASYTTKKEKQNYAYDSTRYSSSLRRDLVQTNVFNSSSILYKRNATELAVGYYGKFIKEVTYNVYAGLALYNNHINDSGIDSSNIAYTRHHHTKANQYFIQGSINIIPSTAAHLSFGAKLSSLHFSSTQTNYQQFELEYFYLDKIQNKSFVFFEPFVNFQLGIPKLNWIKLDSQLSLANNFEPNLPKAKTLSASLGLTVEINNFLKAIKH